MNKTLFISLAAVVSLVSQGWSQEGEHCKYSGSPAFCQWSTGCFTINNQYGANIGKSCSDLLASCEKDGSIYTGVPSSALNAGNNYGEDVNCGTAGGTWVAGKDPSQSGKRGYCNWGPCDCDPNDDYSCTDGGCFEIENDEKLSDCNDVLTSLSQCPRASLPKADGGTCGGSSPIKPGQKLETSQLGLTVIHQAGSLLISSLREATVFLFDMRGQQVFSKDVAAGYSTLRLNGQKQGVYYAVVSSGSSKQTVKIVLK